METPFPEWSYRALLTLTRNWGTYAISFDNCKRQLYSLFEITWSPKKKAGWSVNLSGALDYGSLLGNNTGGMLVIRKTGIIK